MGVAVVCDECGAVGPTAPRSEPYAEDLAVADGWGFGRRETRSGGFHGWTRTILCPPCKRAAA